MTMNTKYVCAAMDLYLNYIGMELTEEQLHEMFQELKPKILKLQKKDISEPEVPSLTNPMNSFIEKLGGYEKLQKVKRVKKGCEWIVDGIGMGNDDGKCHIETPKGISFCKYHTYVRMRNSVENPPDEAALERIDECNSFLDEFFKDHPEHHDLFFPKDQ